ncbi:MAG: metallophosphoesterase family protein [Caldisphaera sp.]
MLATSDIHSPIYFDLFFTSLNKIDEIPCIFLLAGDIINKGKIENARPVFDLINNKFPEVKVIAVFGNDEYSEIWDELRKKYSNVTWLLDEYIVVECNKTKIAIVGTPGAIDKPTKWQLTHINGIQNYYQNRVNKIKELLIEAKGKSDKVILLSHYGLSSLTLKGEKPFAYSQLYSSKMEKIISEIRPDVAIHGHAHKGKKFAILNNVPIYNVAIPLVKEVVKIKFKKTLMDLI